MNKSQFDMLFEKHALLHCKEASFGLDDIGFANIGQTMVSMPLHIASSTRKGVVNLGNYVNRKSKENLDPGLESLGYTLGKIIKSPKEFENDTGPLSSLVQNIKDTETAELYLREADRLRRKLRVVQKKKQREEALKREVSRSRYF